MKTTTFICLLLSVSSFTNTDLATEVYEYTYSKLDAEMPELNKLLNSKELAYHFEFITKMSQKLQNYYSEAKLMEIEEENARKYGNTTLEVSIIFSNQMLENRVKMEKYSERIFSIQKSAETLVTFIKDKVQYFDSDLELKVTNHLTKNKKFNDIFDSYTIFFTEAREKFNKLLEINKKIKKNKHDSKLYNAFYLYLEEIKEKSDRSEQLEKKQYDINLEKIFLVGSKLQIERELLEFKPHSDKLLFGMLDSKANMLFETIKLMDTAFKVLLKDNWGIQVKERNREIEKRISDIHNMKYLKDLLKRKTEEINKYDLYVTDEDVKKLGIFKREGDEILTKMTMEKALRGQKCEDLNTGDFEKSIQHEIMKLQMFNYKYVILLWRIFSFYNEVLESYCQIYNYVVNTIAHSSAAYLNLAMANQFDKIVIIQDYNRFTLLKNFINMAADPNLLKYWKLKKKTETRMFQIIAVEDEKYTGFSYLGIFVFIVMIGSSLIGLLAVKQREDEKEIERLNRVSSSVSFG